MKKVSYIFLVGLVSYCLFNSLAFGGETNAFNFLSKKKSTTLSDQSGTSNCVCGISGNKRRTRILRGDSTHFIEYPWLARIYFRNNIYCVGTLLTRSRVLSAAHCLSEKKKYYKIHLNDKKDYKVNSIIKHPNFRKDKTHYYKYNIAIAEINDPTTLSRKVVTGCLPEENENFEGQLGTIAGWGKLGYLEPNSKELQALNVTIQPKSFCNSDSLDVPVDDHFICAGSNKGRSGPCDGDDGGPLMVKQNKGYFVVAAVLSEILGCEKQGYPTVGTKLNDLVEWITQNIGEDTLCPRPV